ncbi:hypothetical protein [Kineosporia sp. A_224]|uniref:hypothetical protein n=1 Tax=Kineosporia sp. A_224 TaxID=1962180 RepID=UPI000B4B285B|nr:hypothetical protein [Kineosporia sp. A_224]
MRGTAGDPASAARARCAAAVCALVAVLAVLSALPALTPGPAVPAAAALAVLALALVGLTHAATRSVVPVQAAPARGRARAGDAVPSRAGTATDPVHHPLRPRAPGQA